MEVMGGRRGRYLQVFQYVDLFRNKFRPLKNAPIFLGKFSQMITVQDRPDPVTSLARFPLRDPDQKKRQKADHDVRIDPIFPAMGAF